jgi:hypothetical protein
MSDHTPADVFMSTAQALGLSPRQRREGLEEIERAASRLRQQTADPADGDQP